VGARRHWAILHTCPLIFRRVAAARVRLCLSIVAPRGAPGMAAMLPSRWTQVHDLAATLARAPGGATTLFLCTGPRMTVPPHSAARSPPFGRQGLGHSPCKAPPAWALYHCCLSPDPPPVWVAVPHDKHAHPAPPCPPARSAFPAPFPPSTPPQGRYRARTTAVAILACGLGAWGACPGTNVHLARLCALAPIPLWYGG